MRSSFNRWRSTSCCLLYLNSSKFSIIIIFKKYSIWTFLFISHPVYFEPLHFLPIGIPRLVSQYFFWQQLVIQNLGGWKILHFERVSFPGKSNILKDVCWAKEIFIPQGRFNGGMCRVALHLAMSRFHVYVVDGVNGKSLNCWKAHCRKVLIAVLTRASVRVQNHLFYIIR